MFFYSLLKINPKCIDLFIYKIDVDLALIQEVKKEVDLEDIHMNIHTEGHLADHITDVIVHMNLIDIIVLVHQMFIDLVKMIIVMIIKVHLLR